MKNFLTYLQEKTYDGGDCFPTANQLVLADKVPIEGTQLDDYKIVHALVYGQGVLKGRRFAHAFLLFDNKLVVDNSNGNNIVMMKKQYYKMGKINEKERGAYYEYTPKQAQSAMVRVGTHGPWDIDMALAETFETISKYRVRLTAKEKKLLQKVK